MSDSGLWAAASFFSREVWVRKSRKFFRVYADDNGKDFALE
jgi:hypothetical protein